MFLLSCLGTALGDVASASPDFSPQIVGASAVRYGTSFAADPAGRIAIAYFKGDRKLYYYWLNDSGWQEDLVSNSTLVSLGARNYTRTVYLNSQPDIIYYDSVNEHLSHAWRTAAGVWSLETIDNSVSVGTYLCAIACGAGKICISYYDATNTALKYAVGFPGSWTIATVDAASGGHNVGKYSHITLNTSGRPIISYYDATEQLPKFAVQDNGGVWSTETLPPNDYDGNWGFWSSVVESNDGTVHLAAGPNFDASSVGSNGNLYYAKKPSGGSWTVETLSLSNNGRYGSISLLPNGHPQIAAEHNLNSAVTGTNHSIYYTYQDGSNQWQDTYFTPDGNTDSNYNSVTSLLNFWGDPVVGAFYSTIGGGTSKLVLFGPLDSDSDSLPENRESFTNSSDADDDSDTIYDGVEVQRYDNDPADSDSESDGLDDLNDPDSGEPDPGQLVFDGSQERTTAETWSALSQANQPFFYKNSDSVLQRARSLFIQSGSGQYAGVVRSNIATSQSTSYFLKVFYRRLGGTLRIRIGWGSDADFELGGLSDDISNTGAWQSYARSFTTPGSAGDLRLLIDTNDRAYFDTVLLIASGGDADNDGVLDQNDNCPGIANADQADSNTNGIGDACDLIPTPTPTPTETPTATPTPTLQPATTRVIAVVKQRVKRTKIDGTVFVQGQDQATSPLADVGVNLYCGGKKLPGTKRSSLLGRVVFIIKPKRPAKCFLKTVSGIQSNKVKVKPK